VVWFSSGPMQSMQPNINKSRESLRVNRANINGFKEEYQKGLVRTVDERRSWGWRRVINS